MLLTKHLFSWLLVLVMIFSTIQVTMANDTDQSNQGINCHTSHMQMSGNLSDICPMQNDQECQQHSSCVVNFTIAALPLLNTLLPTHRDVAQLKFIFEINTFASRYPSQLKRPPRS